MFFDAVLMDVVSGTSAMQQARIFNAKDLEHRNANPRQYQNRWSPAREPAPAAPNSASLKWSLRYNTQFCKDSSYPRGTKIVSTCVYSTWKRPALWILPAFPLCELELRVVWFGRAHCHLPRELWTHSSFLSFCLFFKTALFQFRSWQRFILLQGKTWLEQTQSKGPVLILTARKPSPEDKHFLSSYFHFHQVKIWVPNGISKNEQKCLMFTESTRNTTHFPPRHCQLLQPTEDFQPRHWVKHFSVCATL